MDLEIERPDTSKSSRIDNFRNTISNFRFNPENSFERQPEESMTMDKYFGANFSVLKPDKTSYLHEFGHKKFKQIEEDSEEESHKGNIKINESDEDFVSDSNLASTHNNKFFQEIVPVKREQNPKRAKPQITKRNSKERKEKNDTMDGFFIPKERRVSNERNVVNFSDHIAFRKTSSNLGFVANMNSKPSNTILQKQTFYGTRGRLSNGFHPGPRMDSDSRERALFKAMDQTSKITEAKFANKKSGIDSRFKKEEFKLLDKYASRFNLTSDERKQIKRQLYK